MKIRITLTTLSLLFLFSTVTVLSQQLDRAAPAVPAEKKRAMNKFDPVDIFPEAKERGGKDRSKRNENSPQSSILANNPSSVTAESSQPTSPGRQRSRRHRSRESREGNSETALAVNSVAAPTPVVSVTAMPTPSPLNPTVGATEPAPLTTPSETSSSGAVMGGAAAMTTPPSQSLTAVNKPPALSAAASTASSKSLPGSSHLSLPLILTLISLVSLALIFALVRLTKQFRKSVN